MHLGSRFRGDDNFVLSPGALSFFLTQMETLRVGEGIVIAKPVE
jgi:hypothetical protein